MRNRNRKFGERAVAGAFVLMLNLLLLGANWGCSAHGKRIEGEQYSSLEEGKTTKSQLIAALGEPVTRGFQGSDEVLGYQYSKVKGTTYIPVVSMFSHGAENQFCQFTFNRAGILTTKQCSEGNYSGGMLGN